ncbi:MAG: hypothetical protein AAF934_01140 [Bacteroidota bacterium]
MNLEPLPLELQQHILTTATLYSLQQFVLSSRKQIHGNYHIGTGIDVLMQNPSLSNVKNTL